MRKIGSSKKILGQKVGVKNFFRKMRKIGLVREKILDQQIEVRNSS